MTALRCLLGFVLLGTALVSSPAQAQSAWPPYRQYTANTSLPTNLTKAVVQDESGRLWIGTDNGLVRFDGSEFETYRDALRSPLVKDVQPGPEGRLLVVTDRGIHEIVQRRDSVSFPLMVAGRDTRTDSTIKYPKAVYRDRQDRLWIAEWDAIARYDDGALTRYIPEPDLERWSDRFMRSFLFAEPSGGPLVAAAQRGYVFAFDSTANRFRRPDRTISTSMRSLPIPREKGSWSARITASTVLRWMGLTKFVDGRSLTTCVSSRPFVRGPTGGS